MLSWSHDVNLALYNLRWSHLISNQNFIGSAKVFEFERIKDKSFWNLSAFLIWVDMVVPSEFTLSFILYISYRLASLKEQ